MLSENKQINSFILENRYNNTKKKKETNFISISIKF